MSSAAKRKRATGENSGTPKRVRSTKAQSSAQLSKLNDVSGWDAAFNPPAPELSTTNEAQESGKKAVRPDSPDAINFEDFVATSQTSAKGKRSRKLVDVEVKKTMQFASDDESKDSQSLGQTFQETDGTGKSLIPKTTKKKNAEVWKISQPIGGRLINMDPVFAADEKHLIVASRVSIHVYSTSNSLLIRSIKLKVSTSTIYPTRIVAFALSPNHANIIWVACSDACVYRIDWTTGGGAEQSWGVSSQACIHMTVASMESAGRRRDVVFTTEVRKEGGFRITANELATPDSGIANNARTIYTSSERITLLKTSNNGSVVVGSSGNRILVGSLRSTDYSTIDKIRYEFRVFESSAPIKSLDIRASDRPKGTAVDGLKGNKKGLPVVDVVIGDIKGLVYVHTDLLLKLFGDSKALGLSLVPRKLHWHRQVVHTVKWSLDGNYIISGGAETVLSLWQLDTGKQQFLPHMSATIQNVVVSPTGSSYAVQFADNSAMILSTAELKPTANISGIQLSVIEPEAPIESQILMIEDASWLKPLVQRVPAVINPAKPSSLLLGVGQIQTIKPQKPQKMSNPYLETFDLGAGHNISHQALARTNITNINAAAMAFKMTEPRVTHIKISSDGQWLATVDEWTPPAKEFDHLKHMDKVLLEEQQHRREVFLKFWQWNKANSSWELVSRINAPHSVGDDSADAGRILDVAVDPSSLRFSTIGEDGVVRNWIPKTRKRDGIVVRDQDKRPLRNWVCENAVFLRKLELLDTTNRLDAIPKTGLLAFSDDGSVLAAACSSEDGIVYLVNPESGAIRTSHFGLFETDIYGLQILGQDLIILSDHITVFDLVSQELRYGIKLHETLAKLSIEQKQEMMHLATDERSQSFAVAFPKFSVPMSGPQTLWEASSELFVFSQDSPTPQYRNFFSSVVSALIPIVSTQGYLVLDTSAEIYTISKKGAIPMHLAQSTSALQLDSVPEEATDSMQPVEVQDMEVDDGENSLPTPEDKQVDNVEGNDYEAAVVSREQLSHIFDIGPAFALPPMEEMFYQVAGLFTAKPLVQSAA